MSVKAEEFLKDRFLANYFVNNQLHSLTTMQLKQLLEYFLMVALKDQQQTSFKPFIRPLAELLAAERKEPVTKVLSELEAAVNLLA